VAAYRCPRRIVERRPLDPAVVEHKPQRLNQVYRYAETRRNAQQRAGILGDIGFEQRKSQ
jgi:hypothetical protein